VPAAELGRLMAGGADSTGVIEVPEDLADAGEAGGADIPDGAFEAGAPEATASQEES
jgi:hypothetical protein